MKNKNKTILVIDDCAMIINLVTTILEMEGFKILSAETLTSALEILSLGKKENNWPKLMLLDFNFDNISGPEFLDLIEQRWPEILNIVPVVYLTGMSNVPPSKAKGLIQKVFDVDEFVIQIKKYLS
jgi:DNA-binding NtrC family response regulator